MSLVLILAATWALVALTPLLSRFLGRAVGWPLAAGLLAVAALLAARRPEGDITEAVQWIPALGVAFGLRLNGLGFLFAGLVLIIGAIVLIYSASYKSARATGFFTTMMAFAAAMLTLVLADDLVVLFVAWELTTIASFLLILGSGESGRRPATRTLLVTAVGGQALLAAVILIAVRTGTTELTAALGHDAWNDTGFTSAVAVLIAVAAMTKSAQFPFHSWLPDAMVAPAPVSAYLHAAAMVKAGIFLLMVFSPAVSAAVVWPILLVTVGVITTIMGAVFALRTKDIKQLFAYSTVSQLGLLVAVIGIGTPLAMKAASIHVLAHGLFKAAGFMAVGLIEKRAGTRDVRELRGLRRSMPWDTAMLVLAATPRLHLEGGDPRCHDLRAVWAGMDRRGWRRPRCGPHRRLLPAPRPATPHRQAVHGRPVEGDLADVGRRHRHSVGRPPPRTRRARTRSARRPCCGRGGPCPRVRGARPGALA